ncbi:MAG: hypothetical protein CVU00_08870 [Bacteroidetes bacterium HGW-Bacteroidetes-17]|nr:MAG: hypothetical protein CVU00_08870 [Bacteroidetes bacterium HGW-Bacteroidetes-17]
MHEGNNENNNAVKFCHDAVFIFEAANLSTFYITKQANKIIFQNSKFLGCRFYQFVIKTIIEITIRNK